MSQSINNMTRSLVLAGVSHRDGTGLSFADFINNPALTLKDALGTKNAQRQPSLLRGSGAGGGRSTGGGTSSGFGQHAGNGK